MKVRSREGRSFLLQTRPSAAHRKRRVLGLAGYALAIAAALALTLLWVPGLFGGPHGASVVTRLRVSPGGSTVAGGRGVSPTLPPLRGKSFTVPPDIASDCSRDVTVQLETWIRHVPDHSTLNFAPGACYRVDDSLVVSNRRALTFNGNGAVFDGQSHFRGHGPHWGIIHSRDITFTNMTVRGANPSAGLHDAAYQPAKQWEAAWDIEGSRGVLLDAVQAYDVFGDFVTIQPREVGHATVISRGITIQNSRFERNGRMGIAITGARDVTISHNFIGDVRHSLLDLEPEWPTVPIDNVRFVGNTTGGVWLLWVANGGSCNQAVSNIFVQGNLMQADAGMPLFSVAPPAGCPRRGPFTIEGNTLIARSSPDAAVQLVNVHDALIRNNIVRFGPDPRTRILVSLTESTGVSVLDNVMITNQGDQSVFVVADVQSTYVSSGNSKR